MPLLSLTSADVSPLVDAPHWVIYPYCRSRVPVSLTLLLHLYFPSPYILYYDFALTAMILLDTNDRLGAQRWYVAGTRILHQLSTSTYGLRVP